MNDRWPNQDEAVHFALSRPSVMLDMEMGTGKTRVALDVAFERSDVSKILIVCPKAVVGVWRENLLKFFDGWEWLCWDKRSGTVADKTKDLDIWFNEYAEQVEERTEMDHKKFVIVNYDSVWRSPLGDYIYRKANFDMVILDESHRAKSAGSKVSKYLAMLGKKTRYKMCLSGTPMANSPLDVYGQYRFLDPSIFGTRHDLFLQEYAVMGGPDLKFIVGLKNQKRLNYKFNSIAYHCKMSSIADRLKLPDVLPPSVVMVSLPKKDMNMIKDLTRDFIAEYESGIVTASNVLVKLLRIQQVTSGFCQMQESVYDLPVIKEMNSEKEHALEDLLEDLSPAENVVVFCQFRHDLEAIERATRKKKRLYFELSGAVNTLDAWKEARGAIIGVQIQAGAEGVDMTVSNHAIYYSIPHSLALYEQSKARLYRPGQRKPVSFVHIIAEDTIDEDMYRSLQNKKDVIEAIKDGTFDYGGLK